MGKHHIDCINDWRKDVTFWVASEAYWRQRGDAASVRRARVNRRYAMSCLRRHYCGLRALIAR